MELNLQGLEGLLSLPVIVGLAWWFLNRLFKSYVIKLDDAMSESNFEKWIDRDYTPFKTDMWKERDSLRSDVDQIKGHLGKNGYKDRND